MNGAESAFSLGQYPMPSPSNVPAAAPVRKPVSTRNRLIPMCSSNGRPL